jgi:hypothetical protein
VTLPPDFWTKPQPGGGVGLVAGSVIGAALWCYFFLPAYLKARWPSLANSCLLMVLVVMLGCGVALGITFGSLIAFEFGRTTYILRGEPVGACSRMARAATITTTPSPIRSAQHMNAPGGRKITGLIRDPCGPLL